MTSYFDITPTSTETVALGKDRKTRFLFTVTSRAEMTVRAIVQVVALTNRDLPAGTTEVLVTPDTKWLTVMEKDKEKPPPGVAPPTRSWDFRPKETRQIAVDLEVPETAQGGLYRFKLVVALEEDPGAHSSSSTSLGFKVPGADVKPKPKWPLILAAVAAVLVVGIGITFAISAMGDDGEPDSRPVVMVDVPQVEGEEISAAVLKLAKAGLNPVRRAQVTIAPGKTQGTVLSQTPKAGTKLEPDGVVELEVAGKAVKVPAVTGKPIGDAETLIIATGLACKVTGDAVTGKPQNTVLTQSLVAGADVAEGTLVGLTIEGQGVAVPNVVGQTLTNALLTMQANHLDPEIVQQADNTKTAQTVAAQVPAANSRVRAGTKVRLTVWVAQGKIRVPPKFRLDDQIQMQKRGLDPRDIIKK